MTVNNTKETLHYRVAVPDDAAQLQAFVKSAYRGESSRQGWTTEADLLSDERISIDGMMEKITTPDSSVLIVTNGDEKTFLACCEVLKRSDDLAYFGMFAVDPARQGQGLGRQVLAYAEMYCVKTWGVKKVEMSVIWTREELISWYVRRGYKKTGETRPFPYSELVNGVALRDDLYFDILEKDLAGVGVEVAA
ncbi:hypothetical protein jhhlp_005321 [Lomentospora prolificans]|uniref:N-acetyltransferase domain-containing protein n=1 Tax=Lomentospora prolificans TaxID=41688 RepID=A0A2N3N7I9_9PEZI|nr:hypothetical protein jhhlp_005321 [Lomentospora prolificans]